MDIVWPADPTTAAPRKKLCALLGPLHHYFSSVSLTSDRDLDTAQLPGQCAELDLRLLQVRSQPSSVMPGGNTWCQLKKLQTQNFVMHG